MLINVDRDCNVFLNLNLPGGTGECDIIMLQSWGICVQ